MRVSICLTCPACGSKNSLPEGVGPFSCYQCGKEIGTVCANKCSPVTIAERDSTAIFNYPSEVFLTESEAGAVVKMANDATIELLPLKDDRAIVLVCALLVEQEIDEFLRTMLPKFSSLKAKNSVTLSIKIDFARALDVIPSRFFNDADVIRNIRNDFSHEIGVKSLSELPANHIQSIRDRLAKYGVEAAGLSEAEAFLKLTKNLLLALRTYSIHAAAFSQFVRSDEFFSNLEEFITQGRKG